MFRAFLETAEKTPCLILTIGEHWNRAFVRELGESIPPSEDGTSVPAEARTRPLAKGDCRDRHPALPGFFSFSLPYGRMRGSASQVATLANRRKN